MTKAGKIQTKVPPFEVDPASPFKGDALGREELCERWTNFVENSTTPYVMAIDGKWGTGKTTLLRMWAAYLRSKGFKCVEFNAWQADFYGEALPALIGEITGLPADKNLKAFTAKVKKLSRTLFTQDTARKIIPLIAKEVSGGKAVAAISKAMTDALKDHDAVAHYKSYRNAVDEFKEALQKFASGGEDGRPLVIFVDELDRCRPDFALDILEKVKHVFDVESVFFVFAVNKEELGKTIQSVYGEIDSERYLRKFFDHTFILANEGGLGEAAFAKSGLAKHLQDRIEWLRANNLESSSNLDEFPAYWYAMIKTFKVSLRDEEQILSALNIAFHAFPQGGLPLPIILAYFAILKVVNRELYEECRDSFYSEENTPFPGEEFTSYYLKNTDVVCHEKHRYAIPRNDLDRYVYGWLCAIRCRSDTKYEKEMQELTEQDGLDSANFAASVLATAAQIYVHIDWVIPDIAVLFETFDSIGGFQFEVNKTNE